MKQLTSKELKKFLKEIPKRKQQIVLILENIQYERNVASIFRTADAAGVLRIYLTGISKTPPFKQNLKMVSRKKENSINWFYEKNSYYVINKLKRERFLIVAIELTNTAIKLSDFKKIADSNEKIAFVVGSEMFGVTNDTLKNCDLSVFLPMYGKGASMNVSHALAATLYAF